MLVLVLVLGLFYFYHDDDDPKFVHGHGHGHMDMDMGGVSRKPGRQWKQRGYNPGYNPKCVTQRVEIDFTRRP